MTLFEPTLKLSKLKVLKGATTVYSERFHDGVNIIRGQNSSGKSTIVDLIAYALGGENVAWKQEALLCTDVVAEIECNGRAITLRRPINEAKLNPMYIYWDEMTAAENAPFSAWELYPFRRSSNKESFSQILFRALGMPEIRGDADSNITMHQVLRMVYVDQRSLHGTIFRNEPFDSTFTRETVGNYLVGVYDDKLYESELRLRTVNELLSKSTSDLRTIFSVLGKAGQDTNIEWVGSKIQSARSQQEELSRRLVELRNSRQSNTEKVKDPGVKTLRARLSEAKRAVAEAEDKKISLELDIEDSDKFISELARRLESLNESQTTRAYLGTVHFSFCPCCLSAITKADDSTACELCKNPLGARTADSQVLRMKNELELQRSESIRLMDARVRELKKIDVELPSLKSNLKSLEKEYNRGSTTWTTELEQEIEQTAKRLGEVEMEISQLLEFQKLGSHILDLQKEKARLSAEASDLTSTIERLRFTQEERKVDANFAVQSDVVELLRADLPREEEFINAQVVNWGFGDNYVTVNGKKNFSESSMVYLTQVFHLSLLLASAKHKFFRLPRFLALDGVEDGGLEIERSHLLQEHIVEASKALTTRHQIIFATSQINPKLEDTSLVVGRYFTQERKSLELDGVLTGKGEQSSVGAVV